MAAVESTLVKAWYQGAWWLLCLLPFSFLFWCVSALRRLLYRSGLRERFDSRVPVVVVGNITVGGSGKSPLVTYLVNAFREAGLNPGIVSRGYGAKPPISEPLLLNEQSQAEQVGDEPLMLFRALKCPVCVCPERYRAVQVLEKQGCDIIISDDGLQHYAMGRDIEICVFDRERLWGNGKLLPAGPLREPLSRLSSVDFIVLNGVAEPDSVPSANLQDAFCKQGASLKLDAVPVMEMTLIPDCLKRLGSDETLELAHLAGKRLCAMAGIGHPERFFDTLRALGADVQARPLGDHHQYAHTDFEGLEGAMIVMTEKDAVKCRHLSLENVWYLPVTAHLSDNLAQAIRARLQAQSRLRPNK